MQFRRSIVRSFFSLLAVVGLLACAPGADQTKKFTEPVAQGGYEVEAAELNRGEESYMLYCFACHSEAGDGKGPASKYLRPPPRDFRIAKFKFAKTTVASGLPSDDNLYELITKGLHGSAMLPWDVPAEDLYRIIEYIKTFSPEWAKVDTETGLPGKLGISVESTRDCDAVEDDDERKNCLASDPWTVPGGDVDRYGVKAWSKEQNEKQAVMHNGAYKAGWKAYHENGCWKCHASYATADELKAMKQSPRANLFASTPVPSQDYTVSAPPGLDAKLPDLGRACDPDGSCPEGYRCDNLSCQKTCMKDSDCPAIMITDDESRFVCRRPGATLYHAAVTRLDPKAASCKTTKECAEENSDEQCIDGKCRQICDSGHPCPSGQRCDDVDGLCQVQEGLCEMKLNIMPPDFLVDTIRSGHTVDDVYRTIAGGIDGAGMPPWRGANMHDRDIWAIAHFVHNLTTLRDTAEGIALKTRQLSSESK
jgi:mono/diheme cytochrome c family protein